MKEKKPACSTTSLSLPICQFYRLEMCIEPLTLKDMLSLEPIISPLKKYSITTFMSQVINSEEDEEQTYSNGIGGGGGNKLQVVVIRGNLKE